jgi:biotin carboxyl carrier protein
MPGKVTKILLPIDAAVTAGQAVLVMEAMKMEYTLKAEVAGTIETIDCLAGDQVVLGKTLVKIKPAAKSE